MMHNCEQIGRYHSRLRIERMVLRALLANRETMRQDRHASAEDIYMKVCEFRKPAHSGMMFGTGPMGTIPFPAIIDAYPRLI
jgi:hypothetical protein